MCQPASMDLCLHCEVLPRANRYRLCQRCAGSYGIRQLYKKRRGWTAVWDDHLQKLTERARLRQPLFPDGEIGELPARPYQPEPAEREQRPRIFPLHL